MAAAGIPRACEGGLKGEWHRFRKTGITERANAGVSARDLFHLARHDDLNTTLKHYDYAATESLRAAANSIPVLNGFIERAKKSQKSVQKDLTRTGGIDEDMGVQTEAVSAHHTPQRNKTDDRERKRDSASEQLGPSGPGRQSCPAVGVCGNGAVGNLPTGPTAADVTSRVLGIIEVLLGIQAGGGYVCGNKPDEQAA